MRSLPSRQTSDPHDTTGRRPGAHGTVTHGIGAIGTGAVGTGAIGTGVIETEAGLPGRLAALTRIPSALIRAMRIRRTVPAAEVPPFPIWPY
ncbi:hypothetical protein [Arenibaculum pallidiluteum]|uniref:hypothetical protein n=1 Tax=Arenibaculum pallidiluteum TaxID=2812559 RepID=UPI001A96180D|nr:hypothetical protein [Arenibaculum pallidiluteum]